MVDGGIVAIVIYDYEAEEDNEIPLREGEKITEIEEAGEGWWQGCNSSGKFGMFPANYVKLVE